MSVRRREFNPGLPLSLVPVLLVSAACAVGPAADPVASSSSRNVTADASGGDVNPDNLRRVRPDFPAGYEVRHLAGPADPAGLWGFKAGWITDPPQCAELARPAADSASAQGLSGSGEGGIIYSVAAKAVPPQIPGVELIDACGRWTMTSGSTTASIELVEAPHIDGVTTVAMVTALRTVVEGGTETDSAAHTAIAYAGDHVVFVTVVTDPGSPQPQLPPGFAAEFLVKAVAALRR